MKEKRSTRWLVEKIGIEKVIEAEEYRFKRVDHIKYLGSIITQDNDIKILHT